MNNIHYSNLVTHLYLLQKKRENPLFSILRGFMYIGIYGFGIWGVSFMGKYGYLESIEMPILIGVFIIFPISFGAILMNLPNAHKKIQLFLSRSVELFVQYEKSLKNEENIEEILLISNDIYLTLSELYNLRKKLDKTIEHEANLYMQDVQEIVILTLKDLQKYLHKKIEEIKNSLDASKNILIENMAIRPYEGIFNTQKIRIDRQIEQFEELQKVLMKI